jgi:hypothetical protein
MSALTFFVVAGFVWIAVIGVWSIVIRWEIKQEDRVE